MRFRLLVDVDEVICTTSFLAYINKYKGSNYSLDDFKEYYIDDIVFTEKEKEGFYNYFLSQNTYKFSELIDGAKESLLELKNYCDIYLYSACVMLHKEKQSGNLFRDKYNFIIENLPFIDPANIVFTNTKNLMVGDIQIDDRIDNLLGPTRLKLLFTAYHNKNISYIELRKKGIVRVNNWSEVKEKILEFINDC